MRRPHALHFDVMHISQRVLDYEDIAVFDMFTALSQQAIGRGQVHEILTEDRERCRPSVRSVIDHLCEVRAKRNTPVRVLLINPVAHFEIARRAERCPATAYNTPTCSLS
jgi:hypothetical protein